ncbi:MAG: nitrate reductase molybdenum cofactor assembly chaperone [Microlunatus sp.]|nr:nitrate reductase molybdenum cofactor assembly chaperone [Microlunatus sp.]MDN5770936.1 nitrate reductase molybdenum cofactor assembly chaperone [Microlunatus sp.]
MSRSGSQGQINTSQTTTGKISTGQISTSQINTYKLASVLLQYPTQAIFDGLATLQTVTAAIPARASREGFTRFLAWLAATPPTEVAQHYVETFDLRRRCALYLTYYRYGDTRKRGMAMLRFKTSYRNEDFVPSEEELPDYLPLVLEFAAMAPRGVLLLRSCRADLELLRKALHQAETPYEHVVDAVCSELPKLRRADLDRINDHWAAGPPREDVGLEPFAPPEYLSGGAVRT